MSKGMNQSNAPYSLYPLHIYTMIRTLLRTPTLARSAPRAVVAGRSVTTRAPTNSSGTPSTDIAGTLAPGEEVDPQRMSLFPRHGHNDHSCEYSTVGLERIFESHVDI